MIYRNYLLIVALILTITSVSAQSKDKSISFKKGEVIDVLVLSQRPEIDHLFENYVKTAFPVAMGMSYKPQPGFRVVDATQGNHQPSNLILGKWDNLNLREQFLTEIVDKVPDFHDQRRAIWSFFGITFYELQEDLDVTWKADEYHVATSYWTKPEHSIALHNLRWDKLVKKHGGSVSIRLSGGRSPFGYFYQPDVLTITTWKREADFIAFANDWASIDDDTMQHVNQFIIQ